ncbi:Cyclic nucleotide-binding domain-containing protein [Schistosoma japonicum]|uniref:Cyclic nucleotide-binding domain-containing protein n=1 Tax=Schistosoma japonicum TaxID=6182 RepID=A0A4Z2DPW9_SCHJA|nr:Cyclic nucleotide-binding domain-containing protein [Schistosoma japonicum]
MNSPWDYELQRHLIQGGRKLSTPSILRKPKRYIQSAGSRLLKEYESDEQNVLNNKYDEGKSRRYNPLDNDEEFLNIEFYADNYPSKRHSSSIDANTLEKRKEYFHRISSSTKLGSLRLTLTDIMKKIEDNECMGIHTFSYLDENNVEKLPIGKESNIHSTSAITRPTSTSPTVDFHQRHSQTGILLPSSQISTSSSPSSLSEDLNNSNETIDEINEPSKFIVSSIKRIQPINAFKRIIIAGLLLRATLNLIRPIQELKDAKLRSKSAQTFVELQKNIEVKLSCEHLGFDKFAFKINREKHLTYDAVKILTLPSKYRTESMIHSATVAVIATIEAFSEFPIAMQKAIIGKAWYEKYEARRMIIRQGQPPLNFYFIISGSVVVSVSRRDKQTGEPYEETVAFLKAGQSFGELALIYGGKRSATIICKTLVELLVMSQDEFNKIFMQNTNNNEIEHVAFLRTIPLIPNEVVDKLCQADDTILLFTYFRRNVTICIDSNQSNWIYIVKTGQCRILKDVELRQEHLKSTDRPKTSCQYHFNSMENKKKSELDHQKSTKQLNNTNVKVFIELKILEPNSVFGLESIAFEPFGGTTSVSLVSNGAECVAINKQFFVENCPTNFLNWLRSKVQPFPSVDELESKLNTYRQWKIYRKSVVRHISTATT